MNKFLGLTLGLSMLSLGSLAHAVGNITGITNSSPYFVQVATKTNVGDMQDYFTKSVWKNTSFIIGPNSSVSDIAIRIPNPTTDSGNDAFNVNVISLDSKGNQTSIASGKIYNDSKSTIATGTNFAQSAYNLSENSNVAISVSSTGAVSIAAS